nr:hypothetical protein [Streptomyces megasporus]
MKSSHTRRRSSPRSTIRISWRTAGLEPTLRPTEQCGLPTLVRDKGRLTGAAETAADARVEYTAFTDKAKKYDTAARLLIRRVKRLNDAHVPGGQGELFTTWRFHVVFPDSPFELVEAERRHRAHTIVEQVFADLEDTALGQLSSGSSPRTRPGPPWPRSPTTSPAPWEPWPPCSTPGPAPALSAVT